MNSLIGLTAIASGVLAGVLGLRAALVRVRDNIDVFIGDIRRQSLWASWAAFFAALSAALQAAERFL